MTHLPGAEAAFIDPRKISAYLLNAAHPQNGGKARFFLTTALPKQAWPSASPITHGAIPSRPSWPTRMGGSLLSTARWPPPIAATRVSPVSGSAARAIAGQDWSRSIRASPDGAVLRVDRRLPSIAESAIEFRRGAGVWRCHPPVVPLGSIARCDWKSGRHATAVPRRSLADRTNICATACFPFGSCMACSTARGCPACDQNH